MTNITVPIVSRAQWGANPLVTPAGPIATPTDELWLHHSGGEQFGPGGMRDLQAFTLHRQDAHYLDLEYTFVVDHADCAVYESRGPGRDTAATYQHNTISHAVCVMGNFDNDQPSDKLLDTLARLAVMGYQNKWWKYPRYTGGHRDASGNSTDCPGNHLEAQIGNVNARAALLLEPPKPPEAKVISPFNPPLNNVVDAAVLVGKQLLLRSDGAVFRNDGHYDGGSNADPNFKGRTAARLVAPNTIVPGANAPVPGEAGYRYVVIASSGERYGVK